MKYFLVLLSLILCSPSLRAQDLASQAWPAWWIVTPGTQPFSYGVNHFRKSFTLERVPFRFEVHVSADNRYRLFVNGEPVATGPATSDLRHWRYNTIDLAPYLRAGSNTLAAVVWNMAEFRPMSQMSHRTGFILQGEGPNAQLVNTDRTWRAIRDEAYAPIAFRDNDPRLRWNYYVAGGLDSVVAVRYPWGWEQEDFADSTWREAEQIDHGAPYGVESHQKWQLTSHPMPVLYEKPTRCVAVIRASGIERPDSFHTGKQPLTIPAGSHATLLIDQGELTTGYPVLKTSGGKDAVVRMVYAEALYDSSGHKGNRNDPEGKDIMGVYDVFVPDGGSGRSFSPLRTRTWRWIQLEIQAADEPLVVEDLSGIETAFPAERRAVFETDDPTLQKIWDAAWRTLALTAQDVLVSDLYWERIPYIGDTRIQALAWQALTGDDRLVRQAIEQFDWSRVPEGLTQSRYPADLEQFTPLYSLVWVGMVNDYWMNSGDTAFVRQFLPGIEQVLGWYGRKINGEGMIAPLFHLDFVDSDFSERYRQILADTVSHSSTVHSLFYAWALRTAADLFKAVGDPIRASEYREQMRSLIEAVREHTYLSERGLFADTPSRSYFSRHANVLAVLADAIPAEDQPFLLERALSDTTALPLQLYFRFFLGRAINKCGKGDLYQAELAPWRAMIDQGMQTFGETAGEPRSEAHPWSASPAYEFLATVAGIQAATPGFGRVRIAPAPGPLQKLHASYPLPCGSIDVVYERSGENGLIANIILPGSLTGEFLWNGNSYSLLPGENIVDAE